MTLYDGLITVGGETLEVTLEVDPAKLQKHLARAFHHSFLTAARSGSAKATRLGRSVVMNARSVTVIDEPQPPTEL